MRIEPPRRVVVGNMEVFHVSLHIYTSIDCSSTNCIKNQHNAQNVLGGLRYSQRTGKTLRKEYPYLHIFLTLYIIIYQFI